MLAGGGMVQCIRRLSFHWEATVLNKPEVFPAMLPSTGREQHDNQPTAVHWVLWDTKLYTKKLGYHEIHRNSCEELQQNK